MFDARVHRVMGEAFGKMGDALASLGRQESWGFEDFRKSMHLSSVAGRYSPALPDQIDMRPLRPVIDRLLSLGSDGNEHMRVGWMDVIRNKLVFGETHHGNSREVKFVAVPPASLGAFAAPVFSVHNHPPSAPHVQSDFEEHLSAMDFTFLLKDPAKIAELVATTTGHLMVMKTGATGRSLSEEQITGRFDAVKREAGFHPSGAASRNAARMFTKLGCIEFGLALYRIPRDELTARKVRLFA